MNAAIDWVKTFELVEGVPSGRWQWSLDTAAGTYRYPGIWMSANTVAPPPVLAVDEDFSSAVQA